MKTNLRERIQNMQEASNAAGSTRAMASEALLPLQDRELGRDDFGGPQEAAKRVLERAPATEPGRAKFEGLLKNAASADELVERLHHASQDCGSRLSMHLSALLSTPPGSHAVTSCAEALHAWTHSAWALDFIPQTSANEGARKALQELQSDLYPVVSEFVTRFRHWNLREALPNSPIWERLGMQEFSGNRTSFLRHLADLSESSPLKRLFELPSAAQAVVAESLGSANQSPYTARPKEVPHLLRKWADELDQNPIDCGDHGRVVDAFGGELGAFIRALYELSDREQCFPGGMQPADKHWV
jgi:hypothetical protein